jgi:Flp pilus assembly CpaE family ATPase
MSSISDSKSALRILRRWDCPPEKVRLTVNFTRQRDGLSESDVEQALNWPVFWSVPYDRRVPNAAQLGESLVLNEPKAAFTKTINGLAGAISGANGASSEGQRNGRRLFGLLPSIAG